MPGVAGDFLTRQLELGEQLRAGRLTMLAPQDLPGRFGRVIRAVDHVLSVQKGQAVVAGGWAVWRHGYVARLTQDVDIVLPKDQIEEFLRLASLSGFEVLSQPTGRWPKVRHKETNIQVDILPEGARPGTSAHPAPTLIAHPGTMGAQGHALRYIELPALIELKLAAGRARDESDIIELLRANPERVEEIRAHLEKAHGDYVRAFETMVAKAREQQDF